MSAIQTNHKSPSASLATSALPAAYAAYASVGPQSPPRIWALLIRLRLAQHVRPNTVRPADRILSPSFRLARSELLLDLDHLAALDLVAVDDRDRLAIADPAVAGVPRRHRRHGLVVEQARDGDRADLPHRVGDVARFRHRQPDRRIADHVD